MCISFKTHLCDVADWNPHITAGMFAWLRLRGVTDSFELISKRAVEQKVLLVPGNAFFPEASGVHTRHPMLLFLSSSN